MGVKILELPRVALWLCTAAVHRSFYFKGKGVSAQVGVKSEEELVGTRRGAL